MIKRSKTNPNHHNAGRIGNFNQDRSRHLAFAQFTVKGYAGNLDTCARLVASDMRNEHWKELDDYDQEKTGKITKRLRNLAAEARDLAEDIAEFNRDKTKLKLEGTKKSPSRPLKTA